MEHLKYVFIVYLPGYAGNFLQRIFSLDQNTVPVLTNKMLDECKTLPIIDHDSRVSSYSFEDVKNLYSNWQVFHREWADFYKHSLICSKMDKSFTHIVFSLHLPEFFKFKNEIDPIKNKVVFYVDLNQIKFQFWVDKSQRDLHFKFRLDEVSNYLKQKNLHPKELHIDLTKIIENEAGFISEYQRICKLIEIPTYISSAKFLYKGWYDTRVRNYI